ncbi:MAG: threonine/serine dehydratase [Gammaproteobacteria bacterium]|nr:threonine/serine dehydratase [Gammaproteobacteria bacterium]
MKIANRKPAGQPEEGIRRAPGKAEIAAARARLAGRLRTTPVLAPGELQARLGARIALKCEQFQVTGAFKARGAMNAVSSLGGGERERGVATHSSGNHGAALAWAARTAGVRATIVVPENAVASKRAAIRRFGGEIVDCGPAQTDREAALAEVVARAGATVVHPYDDARVIAGQATATIEFLEAEPRLRRLLVPVGGGGLATGAILAARWLRREVEIIGVEPAGADDTRRSLAAGERVALERVDTLADGLRAQVGVATFPVLREGLSDLVTVADAEILAAMRWAFETMKLVIEPSAATVLAALLAGKAAAGPAPTGAILSGGNIDFSGEAWQRMRALP